MRHTVTFKYCSFQIEVNVLPGCRASYYSPAEPTIYEPVSAMRKGRTGYRSLTPARLDKIWSDSDAMERALIDQIREEWYACENSMGGD